MILFHFDAIVQPTTFAAGLVEPIATNKPRPYSATDDAYWAGWSAAHEDADLALPPLDYTDAERDAFNEGVRDALRQIDFEIEQARAETADPSAEELDRMFATMALEHRGCWGSH